MEPRRARAERLKLRVLSGGAGSPAAELPADADVPLQRVESFWPALAFLVVLTLLRLWVAAQPGLAADEAYYWTWSQALAPGYFDHPPLVAWLIRASTSLFGASELGVRAACVLLGGLAVAALALASRRPWLTVAACATMPLMALGGLLATPDAPLFFGWALALVGAQRGGRWWLLAGLAAGVATMGKLTGLLLFPLLLAGGPREWKTPWPWLGALLMLATLMPNLLWQHEHDWVSLRFQLGHGFGVASEVGSAAADAPGLLGLLEFIGAQAALVGPLLLLAIGAFWLVGWMERGAIRLWWWVSFPPFAFFALAATIAPSEANWPVPAYAGALLGLAHLSTRWRRVAWVGVGLGAAMSALLMTHLVQPLWALPRDPGLRLVGGEILGQAVQAWGVEPVYTTRYQEASWIRFYGSVRAEVLPAAGRPSQYDLWPHSPLPEHALFVRPWRRSPPRRLEDFWQWREGPNTVLARDDLQRRAARWQVFEVRGLVPDSQQRPLEGGAP